MNNKNCWNSSPNLPSIYPVISWKICKKENKNTNCWRTGEIDAGGREPEKTPNIGIDVRYAENINNAPINITRPSYPNLEIRFE